MRDPAAAKLRSTRIFGLGWPGFFLLALAAPSAGCKGSSTSTRIDVTVDVDPALSVDVVHLEARAADGSKMPLLKDLAPAAHLRWTILLPDLKSPLTATLAAVGKKGANSVVTYQADAKVTPGHAVAVSLRLDAICVPVTCSKTDETCDRGTCVPKPVFGSPPAVDGGADSSASGDTRPADGGAADGDQETPSVAQCADGQHPCPGGCVANDDIHTCGGSCTPCEPPTDGTATCDGTSCGGACAAGKKLCLGACVDQAQPCDGQCPATQHACGGLCPSTMDVQACGTSCIPCAVPSSATQATCDGKTCDFQCMTGTHRCGAGCAADSDATACGTACASCPTDPNGAAQCVGGACGIACKMGYHSCGGRCVSNMDVASCGATSCAACQMPSGGSVTCDGTMCVPACPAGMKLCAGACIAATAACSGMCPGGTHDCGGICADSTSVDTCGTSCVACPRPTGANATTCSSGSCDFTCGSGYHRCGTRCAPDNDPTGCGAACAMCPTDPNGSAACVSGTCGLGCKTGFHVCGGKCVDNKALATCGPNDNTSCTACQAPSGGGTASCDGLACGSSCPSTSKLCNGACIPSAMACNGACPAGTHNCSGICQSDTSTSFCGAGCNVCPAPPSNGMAVCNASTGTCTIACSNTFNHCPGTNLCVPAGGCCSNADCTSGPANTTGTCGSANTCSYSCSTNFKTCNGVCISSVLPSCCANVDCPATTPICSASHQCVGRPLGQACSTSAECANQHCVDGVCCNVGTCPACQDCNVDGSGTCKSSPLGAADAACPTSTASCMAGGCNGAGACRPAAAGTACGSACTNANDLAGQWLSGKLQAKACDGVTAGAAGCKNTSTASDCPGGVVCASATACKPTTCTTHADCVNGFYCSGGVCGPPKADNSDCGADVECQTRVCSNAPFVTGTKCIRCSTGNRCPIAMPQCFAPDLVCGACDNTSSTPPPCLPDGAIDCRNTTAGSSFTCFGSAPECGSDGHCHCGGISQCPAGTVCVASACKVAGRQPCVQATDCAYGTCTGGFCPPTPSGGVCTADEPTECSSGSFKCLMVVTASGLNGMQCQ